MDEEEIISDLRNCMIKNGVDKEILSKTKCLNYNKCNTGRNLFANQDMEEESTIIEIPRDLIINARSAIRNPHLLEFFKWCKKNNHNITRVDALEMFMIFHRFDDFSHLKEFFQTLPLYFDLPECLHADIIEFLPRPIKENVLKILKDLETRFNYLSDLIKQYTSQLQVPNKTFDILSENFTLCAYRWERCLLKSRFFPSLDSNACAPEDQYLLDELFGVLDEKKLENFTISNFKEMEEYNDLKHEIDPHYGIQRVSHMPMIHLMNHSNNSNVYHYFDQGTKKHIFKARNLNNDDNVDSNQKVNRDLCENKEVYRVKDDEELYITYGHMDNTELLFNYGFLLEKNQYDKMSFVEKDFTNLLTNKEDFDLLCSKASSLGLLNNLSINNTGPTLNLIKIFFLIDNINKKTLDDMDINSIDLDNTKWPEGLKQTFLKALAKYEKRFKLSIKKLKSPRIICNVGGDNMMYQLGTYVEYIEMLLEIVKSNLKLIY